MNLLPKIKDIQSRTLGMDIKPYIPGDRKCEKEWEEIFKNMFDKIK
jgi:hypothetical protein